MTFEQWAQSRLTAHGFPCGPIDGVIGSGTRAALRAFQATRALPITGQADDATVAALKAPSTMSTLRRSAEEMTKRMMLLLVAARCGLRRG